MKGHIVIRVEMIDASIKEVEPLMLTLHDLLCESGIDYKILSMFEEE